MPHAALKVIRPVIRASSILSPRLAGRLAFRLFCTPIGKPRINQASPAIQQAQALFADAEIRDITHGCGFVKRYAFKPEGRERGTVLLLHGWTGQALFMGGFVTPLLRYGYRVLAIDLPAHGGSSGRLLNFPLAIEAISAAIRDEEPLAGIIGHSFGGAVAAAAIAGGVEMHPPIAARRLVSISAPKAMSGYGRQFSEELGLTRKGHAAFEAEVQAVAGRPMESFSGVDYLRRTQVPALILHAPDDKEIPFADAEALAAASPLVELRATPRLGHRRILMSAQVQEEAAAFIARG